MADEEHLEEEIEEYEGEEEQEEEQEVEVHSAPSYEDVLKAQRITFADVKEHMTGPVISVIVHIVLLSLLGTMVVFEAPKEKTEIEVEMKEVEMKEIEEIPEPPEPPEETEFTDDVELDIETPNVQADTPTEVSVENMAVENVSVNINMPDLSVAPSNSALKLTALPKAYAMRSGSGRKKALKTYGGSVLTENAVKKALKWLKENQEADGSWGKWEPNKPMLTSLSLLCFLAHGENPASADYGETVLKAIKWLVNAAEDMKKRKRPYLGDGRSYHHAVCSYALSEAYGITRMPRIRDAMNTCVDVLIKGMNKVGSYYYHYDKRLYFPRPQRDEVTGKYPLDAKRPEWPHSDLSFAGWNYQALKAAFAAGCDLPGLEEAIQQGAKGLKAHFSKGGFCLGIAGPQATGNPDIGMTCVGVLCMGLFGEGKSKEAKSGWSWLRDNYKEGLRNCSWRWDEKIHKKFPMAFSFALYTWYYQTQVIFQATHGKSADWKRWNHSFSSAYTREQAEDGHWSTPAQKYGDKLKENMGAEWTKSREFAFEKDLNVYATAMCCLGLEVYYRYLPTYKLSRESLLKRPTKIEDDDLGLVIE